MGNITIQGDITAGVPGGAIGGAGNIASGQVLYGTGAGVAGSEAAFAYNASTNLLSIGVGTATETAHIGRYTSGSVAALYLGLSSPGANNFALASSGGELLLNGPTSLSPVSFHQANVERARFAATTGNLLLGTTTDNNFRLDIAASGSSGTLRVYDQTPTTGVTQLVVRAGAGQSTNFLQRWQNSTGSTLSFISQTGGLGVQALDIYNETTLTTRGFSIYGNGTASFIDASSNAIMSWYSATNLGGSADISLSRAGVNALQVGDGGANANGDVLLRNQFASGSLFLSRNGAGIGITGNSSGVAEINNQTAGTFRDLYLRGVRPVGSTVANLPAAAGNTGMMATVTDANATTIGTTVAGGGSDTVLVWSNGTNWRIYAN